MACFEMYVKRKHFLAAFWKAVVVASSPSDKITDFGLECFFFQLKKTQPVFQKNDDIPTPAEILEFIRCICHTGSATD